MKWLTYMPDTGEIVTWGEGEAPAPGPEGSVALADVDASPFTHHIVAGAPVAYTSAQAAAKAARPDYDCRWNNATMAWEDLRPLEAAQAAQIGALAAAYQQAILAPITFTTAAGVTQVYQADAQSVSNATASMLGCQAAQAVPDGFYWVAADNTHVPFTYADLQGLAAAMFAQGHAMFDRLQQRKNAVRAAASVEAVTAVAW